VPNINFNEIPDAEAYPLLPHGTYPFRVQAVEVVNPDTHQERWTLKLLVTEGEQKGSFLRDTLFWSEKALPRIKLFCSRVGIPTDGAVSLEPRHLLDREGYVEVTSEEWDGKTVNRVPFAGYLKREEWLQPLPEGREPEAVAPPKSSPGQQTLPENNSDVPF